MTKNPLAGIRDQTQALEYAPVARKNLAIINNTGGCEEDNSQLEFPLIDIYVNDACNLRCEFCPTVFGKNNLSLEAIPLIASLNPRVITLTGGGEPSIYRYNNAQIHDFVMAIRCEMGNIPLGMMTNGVNKMTEGAINELEWMRVSLNASTQDSYEDIHKRDKFFLALSNVVAYLKMGVKKLGIGFVYTPRTAGAITEFANVIADYVLPHVGEEERKKLTLQFRPVVDKNYDRYTIDADLQKKLLVSMDKMPARARKLLEMQSNIQEVLGNECFTLRGYFRMCYVSVLQMNIDAKGDAYPCPQKAHAFEDAYGNIFTPDFFENLKARVKDSLNSHGCQKCTTCAQAKINNVFSNIDLSQMTFDSPVRPVFF